MMYLVISIVFIFPMTIGSVYAEGEEVSAVGFDKVLNKDTTKKTVSNTCSITPPLNVKSSLILSIVMMCIPGILEKLMEWKNIKCELAVCSYEAVKNNLDPAFCKKMAGYKTCTYIMGEVFAIPPMSILEHLRSLIASVLANPMGIAYSALVKLGREYASKTCGAGAVGACELKTHFPIIGALFINDAIAVVQTFKEMSEMGFAAAFGLGGEDYCDQIGEIREELEGLVNE